jgi:hypothetical protein
MNKMESGGVFLNYNCSKERINIFLENLKQYELAKIKENPCDIFIQNKISNLTKYISEIHKRGINESNLKHYNAKWVISLVESTKGFSDKKRIINAIQIMEKSNIIK